MSLPPVSDTKAAPKWKTAFWSAFHNLPLPARLVPARVRDLAKRGFDLLPRGSLWAVLSRGSNAGLAFLSTVLLARILGPEPYGVYALAVTVLGFLALGVLLGLDGLTPRNLGIYVHNKDWPHAFSP